MTGRPSHAWSASGVIRAKRDGEALPADAITRFVDAVATGAVSDAQIAAFVMAVYLRGMDGAEEAVLTGAMRDSGAVLSWPGLDGPVVDKHSTGGVGDGVSLSLGPMLAACGVYVPMIAGHGLAHTGGTLDKLQSIPGFDVHLDLRRFQEIVREVGVAIVGQTDDLAPADRRFYAVRDVTETVDSLPLIVASILSKKLSEGLDALVMDIKVGNGAFMDTLERAEELARAMVAAAGRNGLPCHVLLGDMNQPLAPAAGNALEVRVALDHLAARKVPDRLHGMTLALGAELLTMTGRATDASSARFRLQAALDSGEALERLARMIVAQGGPADICERPDAHLPRAPVTQPVPAPRDGIVARIDTVALGRSAHALGAGRSDHGHAVDPRVGLADFVELGQRVARGEPLAAVHAASEEAAEHAVAQVAAAIGLDDEAPDLPPLVHRRITPHEALIEESEG